MSGQWWWCLTHGQVEEGHVCANLERLGPYATREEAAGALERMRARTAEQDALDEADREWGARG